MIHDPKSPVFDFLMCLGQMGLFLTVVIMALWTAHRIVESVKKAFRNAVETGSYWAYRHHFKAHPPDPDAVEFIEA